MVGGTTHNQHSFLHLAPPSSSSISPEDDEILKRNTDCVYFLASPLTCKKGGECEYRHSDIARVNPRDCFDWLNGNCLNPRCPFRHPGGECEYRHSDIAQVNPRDCFYWLNGNCLNPKCAFRHPPLDGLVGADVATPVVPSVPASHPASYAMPKQGVACIFFQKGFCLKGHLCPFLHGPPNPVNNKPTQSVSANPIPDPPKMNFPIPKKPVLEQKFTQQATIQKVAPFSAGNGVVDKKVALQPSRMVAPPVMNEPPLNKSNRSSDYPGYHVSETYRIVNVKDADEYSREPSPGFDVLVDNEDEDSEYPRDKDEFGRSSCHDYDVDHVDREMYREHRDYDHFNEGEGHFDVDRLERRPYSRNDRENESDLRHRISKQRRGSNNGLRSVVSREYGRESRHNHYQDHRQDQGTLSSRLRGRIKIPGRPISPTNASNTRVEREIEVERNHLSRYSPGRPLSLNQSRLRDRIKGQRDMMSDTDSKFPGPKRLSELKRHKSNDEQSLGKRKYPKTEESSSFEGPKPLSEILNRKRGVNNNDNIHESSLNTEERKIVPANKEKHSYVSLDIEEQNEKDKPVDVKSVNYGTSQVDIEDALLDEELEGYDDENRDGEYEYEQMEGEEEDYNLDEGEYVEEEDGDEYGKTKSYVLIENTDF